MTGVGPSSEGRPEDGPLRIVLVEFLAGGGVYQFALLMGEALARLGHEVQFVTPPDPEVPPREPNMEHVPILGTWRPAVGRIPPGLRALRGLQNQYHYARNWVRVVRHLRRERPDVAQFADFVTITDGLFAQYVRRARLASVLTDLAHDPIPLSEQRLDGPLYKRSRALRWGLHAAYSAIDVILVLGPYARSQLLSAYRGLRKIEIIQHGSYHSYHDDAVVPASESSRVILFFGTWSRYKGLWLLLDAFERVRHVVPDAQLVVAGHVGNDVDRDGLVARADAIGGVELIPEYVPVEDVGKLFARSRLCVVPYIEATQSGIVHLAFTFARAVVATDVGDLAHVVHSGLTGTLVPANDPDALAAALVELLENPELAEELGTNAHRWVHTDASWDVVAGRLVEIYRDALAARGAPR